MSRDPVELLLRRILSRSLQLSSAATLAVGCSSIETEGTPVACTEQGYALISAAALQTAEPFDFLTVRLAYGIPTPPDPEGPTETWTRGRFTTISAHGTPCATASSSDCLDKLQTHPTEIVAGYCVDSCREESVVTTRGDQVERWAGSARLRELLGTIDSGDEANLMVAAAGYQVPCGKYSGVQPVADGFETYGTKVTSSCTPIVTTRYHLHVSSRGELTELQHEELERDNNACIGRVPAGLRSVRVDRQKSALGDHLAHCAHLEAASVIAFDRLALELAELGAPVALIDSARRAAADEVRHAEILGTLARAHGGEPSALCVDTLPSRTLEEIALENATEGCVRETYGALVGAYQSESARDRQLAQAMRTIAADEARHAALSHRVHAWAMKELDAAARARIEAAQRDALERLKRACREDTDPALQADAGLPSATLAITLLVELERELSHGALRAA